MGGVFYTDEKIMAQSDTKEIGRSMEILIVEVDQQRYEEYLSSRLVSPAKTWLYHHLKTLSMSSNDNGILVE